MSQEEMYPYNLLDGVSITVYIAGESRTIPASNGNFRAIVNAVESGDVNRVRELMDIRNEVARVSSNRVTVERDGVYLDGVRRGGRLVNRIMGMVNRGASTVGRFVKFMERTAENESVEAAESLYDFIEHCSLPITSDGCFIAYKFIRADYTDYRTGTFDNSPGTTVIMPREDVCADRNQACAPGLHVCSKTYLGGWLTNDRRLVSVKVDPKDVVSIPYSYNLEKIRVCRYTVVEELGVANGEPARDIEDYILTEDEELPPSNLDDALDDVYAGVDPDAAETDVPPTVVDTPTFTQKLTAANVRKIKRLLEDDTMTMTAIAARFGVHRRTIGRIRSGEIWANVT